MREKAGPHKAAAAQPRRPQPSRPGLLRHWRRPPSITRTPGLIGRSTTGSPGRPTAPDPPARARRRLPGCRPHSHRGDRSASAAPGSLLRSPGRDKPGWAGTGVQPGAARLSGAPAAAPRELPPRCCRRPVPGARRGQSRSRPRHPQPPRAGSAPTTPVRGPSPRAPAARSYSRAAPLLPRPGLQMAPARVCPQRSAARATIGSGDSCSRAGDTDPGAFGDCGARGRPSQQLALSRLQLRRRVRPIGVQHNRHSPAGSCGRLRLSRGERAVDAGSPAPRRGSRWLKATSCSRSPEPWKPERERNKRYLLTWALDRDARGLGTQLKGQRTDCRRSPAAAAA